MKKIIKYVLIIFLMFSIILVPISILSLYDISKNHVYVMNSNAKNILKCAKSNNYNFSEYCKNYNIPENETIYISGMTTSYYDLIIDANEYCNQRKNISVNPTPERAIDFYWTLKIVDNNISEIWTCKIPLNQEQLKPYSFDEQLDMIPIFKKDKYNYVIGYYKAE